MSRENIQSKTGKSEKSLERHEEASRAKREKTRKVWNATRKHPEQKGKSQENSGKRAMRKFTSYACSLAGIRILKEPCASSQATLAHSRAFALYIRTQKYLCVSKLPTGIFMSACAWLFASRTLNLCKMCKNVFTFSAK